MFFALMGLMAECHSNKKATTASKSKKDSKKPVSASKLKNIATILGVDENEIRDKKLYEFVASWYGVPYKYGGCDKSGTDCSCLTINLYKEVYKKNLPRTADEMMKNCDKLSSSKGEEGDMVFFKINSKDASHVGVLLKNNKFIHASTSKGVIINDLNEAYYKKYFFTYGKLK